MSDHGTSEQKENEITEHLSAEVTEASLRTNEPAEADERIKKHLAVCEQCRQAAEAIGKRLWDDLAKEFKGF